jgi:hypothetical protein
MLAPVWHTKQQQQQHWRLKPVLEMIRAELTCHCKLEI